jgi:hypothetical protein
MSNLVLGLDVSTSVTGVSIVDRNLNPGDGSNISHLDRIEFKKCVTLWDKADRVKTELQALKTRFPNVITFALEEPLLGFSKGMSSAATITTLMRFNGIVSYIGREVFGLEPTYISAAHARKLCGVKLQKTSVAGMPHKEQVFKHMCEHDLSHVVWPLTPKSGAIVGWSRDATDAYVIARAACLVNS